MGANQETLMYTLEKSIKKKADLFEHSFSAYAVRSILASLYLGLGIVISLYTADKLNHVAEGLGKFSYGLMFGWGLLMILYMNAELGTSNMMYMTVASHRSLRMSIFYRCTRSNGMSCSSQSKTNSYRVFNF